MFLQLHDDDKQQATWMFACHFADQMIARFNVCVCVCFVLRINAVAI